MQLTTNTDRLALVGDIGGTNARFGLVDLGSPGREVVGARGYLCRDYPNATDAIARFLNDRGLSAPPALAVVAVAGPVIDQAIAFTNMNWTLSAKALRAMGFSAARLINDYAALALAAPVLTGEDLRTIGPQAPGLAGATLAVLGPGTGFGVSALARDGFGEAVLATEGGHVAFAPADEVEIEVLRALSARHGRASVERLLSGPGLLELHHLLEAQAGRGASFSSPAEVTGAARAGDAAARASIDRFCAILGSVAGDFALAYGAQGGVYVAGGIPPLILDLLEASPFRARFEAKGRFRDYLRAIPTRVIVREHAALLGAARALSSLTGGGPSWATN